MSADVHAFVDRLPKCELHIHIEGSLEPELMFSLAARNKIRLPYESIEALRRAYRLTQLQDFLDIYYQGIAVLITEQDFFDLAWAYLERVARNETVRRGMIDRRGWPRPGAILRTAGSTAPSCGAPLRRG
jgi:adenosine deaminase